MNSVTSRAVELSSVLDHICSKKGGNILAEFSNCFLYFALHFLALLCFSLCYFTLLCSALLCFAFPGHALLCFPGTALLVFFVCLFVCFTIDTYSLHCFVSFLDIFALVFLAALCFAWPCSSFLFIMPHSFP